MSILRFLPCICRLNSWYRYCRSCLGSGFGFGFGLGVGVGVEILVQVLPLLQEQPLRFLVRAAWPPLVGHPRGVESVVAAAVDAQALGPEGLLQRIAHGQHQQRAARARLPAHARHDLVRARARVRVRVRARASVRVRVRARVRVRVRVRVRAKARARARAKARVRLGLGSGGVPRWPRAPRQERAPPRHRSPGVPGWVRVRVRGRGRG